MIEFADDEDDGEDDEDNDDDNDDEDDDDIYDDNEDEYDENLRFRFCKNCDLRKRSLQQHHDYCSLIDISKKSTHAFLDHPTCEANFSGPCLPSAAHRVGLGGMRVAYTINCTTNVCAHAYNNTSVTNTTEVSSMLVGGTRATTTATAPLLARTHNRRATPGAQPRIPRHHWRAPLSHCTVYRLIATS